MSARLRNLPSMLLGQLPTALTLALLGGIAWWGYRWDWNIPPLPELLNPQKPEEAKSKPEDESKESPNQAKPLPLVRLPSEEALKAGIETKPVEERLIGDYVMAHGHIDFDQNHYAHLSTRASGTAWSVHKQKGDEVKKGDVLALIACPELARLKFDLQQTLLTVQARQRSYQRQIKAGESTPEKERESAEFALRDTRLALSKDQQSLQNLGLNVSLEELTRLKDEEQVAARLRTLGIPDSLLQHWDAAAVTGNNLLPMYAPFDGVVVERDIVIGEMVDPTKPQFILADLRRLWIMLHASLEDVRRLQEGQEVIFHLDGPNEDAPPATIKWISAAVDEKTRTVAVRADVPNPQGRLRPGTFGDARILVGQEKRVIVPNGALQTVSNDTLQTVANEALPSGSVSYLVFVRGASDTEFQPLRVTPGPRHKDFTVILSGLQAGQTIAVSGTRVLLSEMFKEHISGED